MSVRKRFRVSVSAKPIDVGPDVMDAIEFALANAKGLDRLPDELAKKLWESGIDSLLSSLAVPLTTAAKRRFARIFWDAFHEAKERSKQTIVKFPSHFRGHYEELYNPLTGAFEKAIIPNYEPIMPGKTRQRYRGYTIEISFPRDENGIRIISWLRGTKPHTLPKGVLVPVPREMHYSYPRKWFVAMRPIRHPGTRKRRGIDFLSETFQRIYAERVQEIVDANLKGRGMSQRVEPIVRRLRDDFERVAVKELGLTAEEVGELAASVLRQILF